jgi:hypothetical protein
MSLSNSVAQETPARVFIGTGTCRYCERAEVNVIWVASAVRGLVPHEKPGGFVPCDDGEGSPPRKFINRQG